MELKLEVTLDATKDEIEDYLGTSITEDQFDELIGTIEFGFDNDRYNHNMFENDVDYVEYVIKDAFDRIT